MVQQMDTIDNAVGTSLANIWAGKYGQDKQLSYGYKQKS